MEEPIQEYYIVDGVVYTDRAEAQAALCASREQ